MNVQLTSSESSSKIIDINTASTRVKKQIIFKEISRWIKETNDVEKIIMQILQQYPNIMERDLLKEEIKRIQGNSKQNTALDIQSNISLNNSTKHSSIIMQNNIYNHSKQQPSNNQKAYIQQQLNLNQIKQSQSSTTPLPKPPKNAISQFTISTEIQLKNQVDSLTQQVITLKNEKEQLSQQLKNQQINDVKQIIENKIQLALRIHEREVQEIFDQYEQSKQYEKLRTYNRSFQEYDIQTQIVQFKNQLQQLNDKIEQNQPKSQYNSSKYSQILHYNELSTNLIKLQQELEHAGANQEINMINTRMLNNLIEKNTFNTFTLPCFYPASAWMKSPLVSQFQEIIYPQNKPKYIILRLLGEGGFSRVFKAFNICTCEFVALKISQLENTSMNKWKMIQREASIYQNLQHQSIVKLNCKPTIVEKENSQLENNLNQRSTFDLKPNINSSNDTKQISEIALEMELCDPLSLFEHVCILNHKIYTQQEKENNEKQLISILIQVVDGLKYLHESNLTHNDISLTNILKQGSVWKLSDFSLAKEFENDGEFKQQQVTTLGTTRPFAPPEKLIERKFSFASDMYSFGVTMFVAYTGQIKLFDDIANQLIKHEIINPGQKVEQWMLENTPISMTIHDEIKSLIAQLTDYDYKKRPTAPQVIDIFEKLLKKSVKKAKK